MPQEYMLNRDRSESDRLEKQHELWKNTFGYLVNPVVERSLPKSNLKVADIGTGTGVWLLDIANATAGQGAWTLKGFDISDAQFPDKSKLPSNVDLSVANFKEPFPPELLGTFDFIHLRLLVLAMSAEEWAPAVKNLATLLKPGGWLQWEDLEYADSMLNILRSSVEAPRQALEEGFRHLVSVAGSRIREATDNLRIAFETSGLQKVERDVVSSDRLPEMREWTTALQMNVVLNVCKQQLADGVPGAWSMEKIESMGKAMVEESKQGAYLNYHMHCLIGQKAS